MNFKNTFRKLGLIDYNGALKIHNELLSVVLHESVAEPCRGPDCVTAKIDCGVRERGLSELA